MRLPNLQLTRRTATSAVVAAAVLGLGGWAFAEGGLPAVSSGTSDAPTTTTSTAPGSPGASTDNVAAAVNTTDGRTVYAISIKIVQTDADTIDATNAAIAVASCADCQTVAIALEGVVVIGDPTNFEPTNLALALNSGCTNCQTLVSAYQHIIQNHTRVRISGAGRQEIAAVRAGLQSLRHSGLDVFAVQAEVEKYAARFVSVLENEVYPIGRPQPSTTATAPNSGSISTTTTSGPVSDASSTTTSSASVTSTTTSPSTTTTAAAP